MFEFIMVDQNNNEQSFFYNQHKSILYTNGQKISIGDENDKQWVNIHKISPETPGKKAKNPETLKIQLGLSCNYSCSYCLQSANIVKASVSTLADADIFIKNLDYWLEGMPRRIEFWGGEPMLYWKKILFLLEKFKERWQLAKPEYVIITNGSLINDEILKFIDEYDIAIAISHDGPGQFLRGPDPLEDSEKKEWIKKLLSLNQPKEKISFNVVLTNNNYDVEIIRQWFIDRLGDDVPLNLEGIVQDYNNGNTRFTEEQYADMVDKLSKSIIYGNALKLPIIRMKIENFINSLVQKRPSYALGQSCGMDRDSKLAVDLLGNVWTCQNVGGQDKKHNIGHVRSFEKISLDTSWHWSNRNSCSSCPVLQLCAGSCMYLEGQEFYTSCDSSFHYNIAILAGAMFLLTGLVLKEVRGNIRNKFPDNEIQFQAN